MRWKPGQWLTAEFWPLSISNNPPLVPHQILPDRGCTAVRWLSKWSASLPVSGESFPLRRRHEIG